MHMSSKTRITIISLVLLTLTLMFWLYYETIMMGISPDYAVEPYEEYEGCPVNVPSPYLWPDTFGQ